MMTHVVGRHLPPLRSCESADNPTWAKVCALLFRPNAFGR